EQYNKEIGDFATSLMLEIGLINKVDVQKESKNNRAYRKYFMHGTSHFLGLDTHDVGDYNKPFEKNMVFTIEPGIYLPKEKLGIRLEDNYVVQKKGEPKNLTSGIPLEISEIEDLILGGH
ncbi:MAG: X-Pro aminopeptidase, partial [Flavobacteriaceae bacterium]